MSIVRMLPDNWRETFATIQRPTFVQKIAEHFAAPLHVIARWRRNDPDFDLAVLSKIKTKNNGSKNVQRIKIMTPDEIDDVILALLSEPTLRTCRHARDAIRQLRREKRVALSEVNRLKRSEHLRRSGRSHDVHASCHN